MRGTRPTVDRQATPASPISANHPIVTITNAFCALEALADERPELAPECQRAWAGLHDLAWFTRSRIFDGRDRSAPSRALERVSIAVAIASARLADTSPAGPGRLRHALGMLATTIEERLSMLTTAAIAICERRATNPAPRPQYLAAESIDAAESPLDRAA